MTLSIDHALIAVSDLAAVAAVWRALGFTPGLEVSDSWGTARQRVGLAGQAIELVTIEDEAARRHMFGGLIAAAQKRGDGVAGLALSSPDPAADAAKLAGRGLWHAGMVERAPALALLPDDDFPDLAVLLCRPQPPDPAAAPPNGCDRLDAAFVLAPQPARLSARLGAIWGEVAEQPGGLLVRAGATTLHVLDEAALLDRFPAMRLPVGARRRAPAVVALSLHTANFTAAVIRAMSLPGVRVEEGALRRVLAPAALTGGVIVEIAG